MTMGRLGRGRDAGEEGEGGILYEIGSAVIVRYYFQGYY